MPLLGEWGRGMEINELVTTTVGAPVNTPGVLHSISDFRHLYCEAGSVIPA